MTKTPILEKFFLLDPSLKSGKKVSNFIIFKSIENLTITDLSKMASNLLKT